MNEAYIIDALRTPVGRYGGALSSVRPDDMAAHVITQILERNSSLPSEAIEDVIMGAANQAGEDNRNVGRMAALLAHLPEQVAGVTVNRLCASSLQSIMDASRALKLNDGNLYLAGGVESMSRAPFVVGKAERSFDRKIEMEDTTIGWRFINPQLAKRYYPYSMGGTAENVAERYQISREEQDEFAHHTQQKYQDAYDAGKFRDEIVPVTIPQRKADPLVVDKDEHPRLASLEKLATLPPAFKEGGSVTAGNASGVNDGAAVTIVANEETVNQYNLKPMAKVVSMAVAGVEPAYMGLGPIPATRKALERAGISLGDIDLVELNEAFAAQSIACIRELGINTEILNVNGGAIALGHPLGCSGARISTTLLHEMQKRDNIRYGLATMCVGVGQGAAVIYEKV
jgi:3-oxoadipyl-CoA thiolase